MKAICAAPASGVAVAQRWTSATRLPSVDSPPRFSVVPSASLARLNGAADLAEHAASEHVGLGDGGVHRGLDRFLVATASGSVTLTVLARTMSPEVKETWSCRGRPRRSAG